MTTKEEAEVVGADRTTEDDPDTNETTSAEILAETITSDAFDDWFQEREWARNIREGTPFFNLPDRIKPPSKHSPSSLLQCHRKTVYKQLNAPEETEDPDGIFWVGSRFEEDLAVPFLRHKIVGANQYVTNSLWVDFSISTRAGDIQIKGETDPVIVDREAVPILLTEIKTKRSVANTDSPNRHHRAQAHAYMRGLSEQYDRTISTAIILYGGRTNLNIKPFRVEFDPWFWREVVIDWAATHTTYRLNDELPPSDPEYEWECKFCPFSERCGQGDLDFRDVGSRGLLPGYTGYPREKLVEYLTAHEDARLTPELAHHYPSLATEYDVFDWQCNKCGAAYPWDAVEWEGDVSMLPDCPSCECEPCGDLQGPHPAEQTRQEAHNHESDNT